METPVGRVGSGRAVHGGGTGEEPGGHSLLDREPGQEGGDDDRPWKRRRLLGGEDGLVLTQEGVARELPQEAGVTLTCEEEISGSSGDSDTDEDSEEDGGYFSEDAGDAWGVAFRRDPSHFFTDAQWVAFWRERGYFLTPGAPFPTPTGN